MISLREGLEISLVVAIILAYLRRTGRTYLFSPVWGGVGAAVVLCLATGTLFYTLVGELEGKTEQLVEGLLALSAVVVLTWMIFWMRKHARRLSGQFHAKVDEAAGRSQRALALLAFVAVAREGFETVLFLVGAKVNASSGAGVVAGGLAGLVVATTLGYVVYQGGHRLDVRRFFHVTGALLVLVAAGLFATGVHELRELFELEGILAVPVWAMQAGLLADGWLGDFLGGMFGWSPAPERLRFFAYLLYLVPVAWFYFTGSRHPTQAPVGSRTAPLEAPRGRAVGADVKAMSEEGKGEGRPQLGFGKAAHDHRDGLHDGCGPRQAGDSRGDPRPVVRASGVDGDGERITFHGPGLL